jgi:Xaa-Pro aminopeptidase
MSLITLEGCRERRRRFWSLAQERCDAALFTRPEALSYFTGLCFDRFEFRSNEAGAVLILTPERSILVGDNLTRSYLERAFVEERILHVWYDGKHAAEGDRRSCLMRAAQGVISRLGVRRWGIDAAATPAGLFPAGTPAPVVPGSSTPSSSLSDIGPLFLKLRRQKCVDELACIRESLRCMKIATEQLRGELKSGLMELDAFEIIQAACTAAHGAPVQIYGDFVAHPTLARRGGPPTARRIALGDLFLVDFSAIIEGYRGDIATTFVVGEAPTQAQQHLALIAAAAMSAGEELLRPGSVGRDIDAAVRAVVAEYGLEHASPSHTGHGLGLGHPEAPFLVRESDDVLLAGDVVTLEPSLFVEPTGGLRLEHNYLITETGFERLSQHSLDLAAC